VYAKAEQLLKTSSAQCELSRGGCYGLCHLGPNVVVRNARKGPVDPFGSDDFQLTFEPGETYYWAMTPEKMAAVVHGHLEKGEPVKSLVGDPDRIEPLEENPHFNR
jgi:(2Fe-2S) ferredoxin